MIENKVTLSRPASTQVRTTCGRTAPPGATMCARRSLATASKAKVVFCRYFNPLKRAWRYLWKRQDFSQNWCLSRFTPPPVVTNSNHHL